MPEAPAASEALDSRQAEFAGALWKLEWRIL